MHFHFLIQSIKRFYNCTSKILRNEIFHCLKNLLKHLPTDVPPLGSEEKKIHQCLLYMYLRSICVM